MRRVGSQRAALRDPRLVPTYSIVRERAPSAFVIANIGVSQLVAQDEAQRQLEVVAQDEEQRQLELVAAVH